MSGNPIPKEEYNNDTYNNDTYNNDDLYIIKSDGTKIYFKQIKELINEGKNYLHYLAGINENDINKLKEILDILCCDYLEVNYEIYSETSGGYKYNYLKINGITIFNLEEINDIVQAKYINQKSEKENEEDNVLEEKDNGGEKMESSEVLLIIIIIIFEISYLITYIYNKKSEKTSNLKNKKKGKQENKNTIENVELESKVQKIFSCMKEDELKIIYDYIQDYKKVLEKNKQYNIVTGKDNLYKLFLNNYNFISTGNDLSERILNYNYYKNIYNKFFRDFDVNLKKQFKKLGDFEQVTEFYDKSLGLIFYQDGQYIDEDALNTLRFKQSVLDHESLTSDLWNRPIYRTNTKHTDINAIKCLLEYIYKTLEYSNKLVVLFKLSKTVNYISDASNYNSSNVLEFYSIVKNMFLEVKDIEVIIKNTKPIYEKFYKQDLLYISDMSIYKLFIQLIISNIKNDNNKHLSTTDISIEKWIESVAIDNRSVEEFIGLNLLYIKSNVAKNNFKIFINELDKVPEYIDLYKNSIRNKKIIMDRQRYLSGNFEQEKREMDLKYSFENIGTGQEFEEYLVKLFKEYGYEVNHTGKAGDQGADLILKYDEKIYAVQAKFYNSKLSNTPVQEIVGALKYYKADKGIVITNNVFTKGAEQLAKANGVILINGNKLREFANNVFKANKRDIFK